MRSSRRAEASTAAAEQAVIQRGAATITLVVLVGLAINMQFAAIVDVIVDKHAFLAGSALEASAQQQGDVRGDRQTFLCGPPRGRIGDIPFDLDSSQVAHGSAPA